MGDTPMRYGDRCPTCGYSSHLRWGLGPNGCYVTCKWCGYSAGDDPVRAQLLSEREEG